MKGKRSRKKPIILAVIAVLIIVFIAVRARQAGNKPPDLETASVKRGTVLSSVSGNGVLQAISTVEVKSNVGGQIVELAVDEGDTVKAGQLIAKIDPSDSLANLESAQADYMSSEAKVNQARQAMNMQRLQTAASIENAQQALESSRQRLAQAKEESDVQPKLTRESISQAQSALDAAEANFKQTKSALSPQKLSSAKSAYDQAQASYDQSSKNLNRQRALLEKGFVSKSVVDDAEEKFSVAKAQLDGAKNKLDTVEDEAAQDLRSAESKVAQASAALRSARANGVQDSLKLKELAATRASVKQSMASLASARASAYSDSMKQEEILQAQAQLNKSNATLTNARTNMSYTTVTAPRDGVVVKKYVEKGSIVTAGRQAMAGSGSGVTIVEIADVSRMRVEVDVDETDVAKIRLGQEVNVTVDALPDELFPAKVIKIAPMAEVTSNVTTVPVTVELERTDRRLKPEMNATCDFVIDRKRNVLYLPVEAITETDSGAQVMLVGRDKPVVRKIEVGLSGDEYCEIISGLKENDVVVITEEDTSSKKTNSRGPGGPPM